MLNNLLHIHSKLSQKEQYIKQQKRLEILLAKTISDKITYTASGSAPEAASQIEQKYLSPKKDNKLLMALD